MSFLRSCTVKKLAQNPALFTILRRIVELNFVSIRKTIKKEICFKESKKNNILDVPCGTGELCTLFPKEEYIGIDISNEYIRYAKKAYGRKFLCQDARRIGFKDASFDSILLFGFFHHLDIDSVMSVLKEIQRISKPSARIILIEDAPIRSRWNIIGKFLQNHDLGNNIRPAEDYIELVRPFFSINKYYSIRNGFLDYSVFVLSPSQ